MALNPHFCAPSLAHFHGGALTSLSTHALALLRFHDEAHASHSTHTLALLRFHSGGPHITLDPRSRALSLSRSCAFPLLHFRALALHASRALLSLHKPSPSATIRKRMFTLPLPLTPETWSVSDLNRYVRQALETDIRLQDVRIRGEISGFKAYPSGHWYFTLKDSSAQISAVLWKQRAARQRYQPRDGDQVEAVGRVTLYEQRGQYQFDVAVLEPVGQGALFAEFARLKAQLEAEGLFNAARKRPLPRDPARIAIITSSSGAALQDMLNILRRRNPLAAVTLVPTPVQGDEAVPGIVAGLKRLKKLAGGPETERPDVIVVARGGGSLEDLWAFNDERVARAIDALRTTPVPVVSGVGHETDFTIADFVADVRAPTPSAAAELCSPITLEDRRRHVDDLSLQLTDLFEQQVQDGRVRLDQARVALRAGSPFGQLALARARLREQSARLTTAFTHQVRLARERLTGDVATLDAFSPLGVLERGYAIVRRPDGGVISHLAQVSPNQPLRIRVRDGEFDAKTL